MQDLLFSTLSKVVFPFFGIAFLLFASKKNRLRLGEDVGIRQPEMLPSLIFLTLWVCLIAAEEYMTRGMPGFEVKAWPEYPIYIIALRILAIGVLGPIAEELAFRGLLMAWLRRTKLGLYGAIVITAAVWSVVHFQYSPQLMALIFFDGIVLGLARYYSGSLFLPIAMHIGGNVFSITQSLGY